ncbi:hypothetical protein BLNAU_22182 [Blattamonas nauphoetae]|uniref:Uncharacterized protein n=1 Tax=Blattamonas nauphoetae TaxID=2049346 RepID=A0ABQ9WTT0_9EUKA|nr:hypothetical protein BLNAU_22182 [Blattamonas nauphoetae]
MTWAIVDLCSRHLMNILCYKLLTCSIIGCAPPDLIDSFLKSVDISSFPSDTPFRHDRDLNLISTLSQSSSPPFTKLSEPLLDLTFPLHSLLSLACLPTLPASSSAWPAQTMPSSAVSSNIERRTK